MKSIRTAFRMLSLAERRSSFWLLLLVIAMALFDMVGAASIMPFLAVLADPGLIERNRFLSAVNGLLEFPSRQSFLYALGAASFCLLITAACVRTAGLYALNRFTNMRSHSLGLRLFETYMRQPYAFFLHRHSGDMAKGLLSEVNQMVSQVYQPAAQLIAQLVMLIAMLSLLIAIDPVVALVMMSGLVAIYTVIYMSVRGFLSRAGTTRVIANRGRFQSVAEALGGIKQIKLMGQERVFLARFSVHSLQLARFQSISTTMAQVPKFAVEALAFGGIILLTLILMARHGGDAEGALGKVLPLLGLYAFAGYRMLPAVQGIYAASTQLRFGAAAVKNLDADLAGRDLLNPLPSGPAAPLPLTRGVDLKALTFNYPKAPGVGLQDITLHIPLGSTLGVVGSTGAGKTTLVDLILGLLRPDAGMILADDTPVTDSNLRNWQADLGYVPQDIFLIDASVAENIAFGVPPGLIDQSRIRDCARMAQILEFIENDLSDGFATTVGERGVRLSGGQRQRLGIARALYQDPGVIVFDEATSALDNLTEREVMRAVAALSGIKTVIVIAHRISTVRNCDRIAVLDKGRLVGFDGYDELSSNNVAFRRLITTTAVA